MGIRSRSHRSHARHQPLRPRTVALALSLLAVARSAGADEPPAPARVEEPQGQKKNGIALATEFSLAAVTLSNSGALGRVNLFSGSFLAGYKLDRLIIGLSIGFSRLATSTTSTGIPGSTDASQATTLLSLVPGVQFALLRSSDRRAELYGEFDIGWLHLFTDRTPAGTANTSTADNGLVYRIGPGVRYWIHPSIAFYVVPTLRGQFTWSTTSSSDGSLSSTAALAATTIDANLGFLGAF